MAGTNKFIQWDQNGTNMYSDTVYAAQTAITDGVAVGEIADPDLHNKLFYQMSTMCAAWGQVFADLGHDVNDSSLTSLTNILNNTVITDNMWSTFSGDFHSQTTNGFYSTSTTAQTHAPNATDKFYLTVATNGTYIYHLSMSVENGTHFYNVHNGSTWSGWSQIATLSGGNFTGAINETLITMASSSTMNIGAAAANYIIVTGTNTITGFDAIQPGTKRQLRFSSPLTVTYNATTMLLPGGTNINVIAGDVMEFVSGGSGIWRCTKYQPWRGLVAKGDLCINVKDYGAKGDGTTDDTTSAQNAIAALATTGGVVYFPTGNYKITSGLVLDRTNVSTPGRINILGDGAGTTFINYYGTAGNLVTIKGDVTSTTTYLSWQTIKDIAFINYTNPITGIYAINTLNTPYIKYDSVRIEGFDYAFEGIDIEHMLFINCRFRWNNHGLHMRERTTPISISTQPDDINFFGCTIGNNSKYGLLVENGALINFFGGDVEYNGTLGDDTTFGVKILEGGLEGGVVLNMFGAYVEGNMGKADVWLYKQANPTFNSIYNFNGVSFTRPSSSYYATNQILADFGTIAASGSNILSLEGTSFESYNSYVPSVSRLAVAFTTSPDRYGFNANGCNFKNSVEKPDFQNHNLMFAEVSKNASQTLTSSTWTQWQLDSILYGKYWSPTINSYKITIPETGLYQLNCNAVFFQNLTGDRGIKLKNDGGFIIASNSVTASVGDTSGCGVSVTTSLWMFATDTVSVELWQSSGAALNVLGSNAVNAYLTITKLMD